MFDMGNVLVDLDVENGIRAFRQIGLSNCVDHCAFRFLGSDTVYSEWYDELVQPLIPGYKYSKRRLSVLRAVQRLGLTKYNDVFITNAINELVSYPEADLPE